MSETATVDQKRYQDFDMPSSRLGMWWFLASEVVTFGGLIAVFLLMKLYHPGWHEHAAETMFFVGATNTYILLTSSLTVVLAHAAAEDGDGSTAARWIIVTLILGLCFLGFKGYEYSHEISHGILPSTNLFWGFYFVLTGLHALHVIGGLLAWVYVLFRVKTGPEGLGTVAPMGLYWHFVDVVWIFLFPLLYLTS